MSRFQWTKEHDDFLRKEYQNLGPKGIAEKLNITPEKVKYRARYIGVRMRDFQWNEETENLLRKRYVKDGPNVIAEKLGISAWSVVAKARRLGLESTRKTPPEGFKWTEEMIEKIKTRYVQEGPEKLAKEFGGVTKETIYRKASDLGLRTIAGYGIAGGKRAEKSTCCDIHFFDKWTPEMAYILGFIFADGSVGKHSLIFIIAKSDKCVLDYIKKKTKSKSSIKYIKARINEVTGKLRQEQVSLIICSTVMVKSLAKLGVFPRKTYNNDPYPYVPDDMFPHFIRGHLDGDGCVCLLKTRERCDVSFVGTPNFIQGLRDQLVRLTGIRKATIRERKGIDVDVVSCVSWSANEDVRKFFEFAYPKGFEFCLERKRQRLVKWFSVPRKETKRWTDAEDNEIKRLHKEGYTAKEIANKLDRCVISIVRRIPKLGLITISS